MHVAVKVNSGSRNLADRLKTLILDAVNVKVDRGG